MVIINIKESNGYTMSVCYTFKKLNNCHYLKRIWSYITCNQRLQTDPVEDLECDKRLLEKLLEKMCIRLVKKQRRCTHIQENVIKKLTSVFYVSVLLSTINFVNFQSSCGSTRLKFSMAESSQIPLLGWSLALYRITASVQPWAQSLYKSLLRVWCKSATYMILPTSMHGNLSKNNA